MCNARLQLYFFYGAHAEYTLWRKELTKTVTYDAITRLFNFEDLMSTHITPDPSRNVNQMTLIINRNKIIYRVQKANIMGSYGKRRKVYKHQITLEMMRGITLRFVKRISIPLFHPSHIKQIADILGEGASELQRIDSLKNLRQI